MVEELDPKKYHVLSPQQKKNTLILVVLVFLLIAPPSTFFYYRFAINRPNQLADESVFEIKSGTGLYEIAEDLSAQELINSKVTFLLHVLAHRIDKNIQAGRYILPAGMSVVKLGDLFQHGTNDVKITFLEGWRVEEIALKAAELFEDIDYEAFVSEAREYEGYLFPDTYLFTKDVTVETMLGRLRTTFDLKTHDVLTQEALDKVDMTKEEVVILASIVEREVSKEVDRPIVAGILIKRWNAGVRLDADATTQYVAALTRVHCLPDSLEICPRDNMALDTIWWPQELTTVEIEDPSLFNTRKAVGLPPHPVSSMSISALKAVLEYKDTDYNYYLTDTDGVTRYARTLEEHTANVYKYL